MPPYLDDIYEAFRMLRYSEDLDFSLLAPNPDFRLGAYGDRLQRAIRSFGFHVSFEQPTRPADGAKIESGVQIIEREVLARLRDQTFFSLGDGPPFGC